MIADGNAESMVSACLVCYVLPKKESLLPLRKVGCHEVTLIFKKIGPGGSEITAPMNSNLANPCLAEFSEGLDK